MPGNDEVPHHEGAPPQGTTGEHRHDSKPAETQGADHGDEAFEFLNEAAGIEEESALRAQSEAPDAQVHLPVDHAGWSGSDDSAPNEATRAHAILHASKVTEAHRRRAAQLLLRTYHGRFLQLVKRHTDLLRPEDVEELTSSSVGVFLMRVPADCANPEGWLYRVFRNAVASACRRELAKRRNMGKVPLSLDEAQGPDDRPLHDSLRDEHGLGDPLEYLLRKQRARLAAAIVAQIAARSQKALAALLLAAKGYKHDQIGAALGMSPSAVGSMLNDWRKKLEKMLKDYDE